MYSSSSMYVGDGTWDSQRNTFLLPNLQGLNFETMRYNGKFHLHCLVSGPLLTSQAWATGFEICLDTTA